MDSIAREVTTTSYGRLRRLSARKSRLRQPKRESCVLTRPTLLEMTYYRILRGLDFAGDFRLPLLRVPRWEVEPVSQGCGGCSVAAVTPHPSESSRLSTARRSSVLYEDSGAPRLAASDKKLLAINHSVTPKVLLASTASQPCFPQPRRDCSTQARTGQ